MPPLFVRSGEELRLAGIGIDLAHRIAVGGNQHAARRDLQQGGDEGPLVGRELEAFHCPAVLVVADQFAGIAGDPDAAQVVLRDGRGVEDVHAAQHAQVLAVVAAVEHVVFLRHREPQLALGVAEDAGAADVADGVVRHEAVQVDLPQVPGLQVIDEQAVVEGGDPEMSVPVGTDGGYGFVGEAVRQVGEVVEAVLGGVGNAVALVGGAEPQVPAAVAEQGADLEIRDLVGEFGAGLMQQLAGRLAVAEHAVGDGVQEHVRAVGEEDVDVAAGEPALLEDGARGLRPLLGTRVEDAEPAHAGQPDLARGRHGDVIDRMPGRPDAGRGEVGRVEAAQFRHRGGPDAPVRTDDGGIAAVVADDRDDAAAVRVIAEQLGGAVEQEPPVAGLDNLVDVQSAAFDRDALEAALVGAQRDAVGRADPEPPVGTSVQGRDLVVRQAERVVRAEVLVVVVDGVFVEPAEGPDPDVAVGVLRESVHPLVGKPVGDDDVVGVGGCSRGRIRTRAVQHQPGEQY